MGLKKGSKLRSRFRGIKTAAILDLLESMLQFNPAFRPTAKECLQNSLFDFVRNTAKERPSDSLINLPVYKEGLYDYKNLK